jgi:hypothetical protein
MDPIVLKRFALIAVGVFSSLGIVIINHPWIRRRMAKWDRPLQVVFYVATRPLLFVILYVVIQRGMVWSDLREVYPPQGDAVLEGGVPGRDFLTQYSPFFPYLLALTYLPFPEDFYASPVIVFMLADLACLLMLRSIAKSFYGAEKTESATWVFILCPLTWIVAVHYGQDEMLTSFFVTSCIYLVHQKKISAAGLAMGIGVMLTKYTTAIGLLPHLFANKEGFKLGHAVATLAPIVLGATLLEIMGASILKLINYSRDFTGIVGGNSISAAVIELLSIEHTSRLITIVTLIALAASSLGLWASKRRGLPFHETVAVTFLVFLLTTFCSVCIYRTWIVVPIALVAVSRGKYWLFAMWSLLSAIVPVSDKAQPIIVTLPVIGDTNVLQLTLSLWGLASIVTDALWLPAIFRKNTQINVAAAEISG